MEDEIDGSKWKQNGSKGPKWQMKEFAILQASCLTLKP
jgi:hypothetical protein